MPRIIFTPAARADLISALNWYETHASHVTPQFRNALRAILGRIAENPKQFPVEYRETSRALLRRFPYFVVFRETEEGVYVIAVFHTSRNPITWQSRPQ
jgi:plasmid stabilization system protein ParE